MINKKAHILSVFLSPWKLQSIWIWYNTKEISACKNDSMLYLCVLAKTTNDYMQRIEREHSSLFFLLLSSSSSSFSSPIVDWIYWEEREKNKKDLCISIENRLNICLYIDSVISCVGFSSSSSFPHFWSMLNQDMRRSTLPHYTCSVYISIVIKTQGSNEMMTHSVCRSFYIYMTW